MSNRLSGMLAFLLLASAAATAQQATTPNPTNPAISSAGAIHPLPHAAYQPDKRATYKVVFSMTSESSKPGVINPALEHVARAVNLYAASGVPLTHLKFVAVAHGKATSIALDDEHYRKKFGMNNPNRAAIRELRAAGVDIAVCGQALAEQGYEAGWIARDVTLALSALTTITTLEHQGYAFVPL